MSEANHHASLPDFKIDIDAIEPTVKALIATHEQQLESLLQQQPQTWQQLMAPLEDWQDELDRFWAPISHLHAVMDEPALRQAYRATLTHLIEHQTRLSQHTVLHQAVERIAQDDTTLTEAQKWHLKYCLRDFHLSGVTLSDADKQTYRQWQQALTQHCNQFEDHVLDATQAWFLQVTDPDDLAGLPPYAVAAAQKEAKRRQQSGWVFGLDHPSYLAVMRYSQKRALREQMYRAHVTRASEQGAHNAPFDNSTLMVEILQCRQGIARLLGFKDYTELSLATKMAHDTEQVLDFLYDLVQRCRAQGQAEYQSLAEFAQTQDGVELAPWDLEFYRERYRQIHFDLSQEDLKPYFPETKVLSGMLVLIERLYGIQARFRDDVPVWHPDVRFLEFFDQDGVRGQIYCDFYARPHKRGGAWMDECRVHRRDASGQRQIPVAFLTCNFTPASEGLPALWTHDEVLTLFHEMGHSLHHIFTKVETAGVSGINGVPWDAVELPSQFFENWCWQSEALHLISGHYQTQAPLPEVLLDKLHQSRHFHTAMGMLRQIEFALFDLKIHQLDQISIEGIAMILDQVRKEVAVFETPDFVRFQHGFSHVFAGGYAAGYYSYKWAEWLSSDAFSLFEERGIFDRATGQHFLATILEVGGAADIQQQFKAFRGRPPEMEALLRHQGIA